MSKINEYRATAEKIKELQNKLQNLSTDEELKQELEFEEKLKSLMNQYNKTFKDIKFIFEPDNLTLRKNKTGTTKRIRKAKRYINPHNNQEIETRGGNHKILKSWKIQYGNDIVESWGSFID